MIENARDKKINQLQIGTIARCIKAIASEF